MAKRVDTIDRIMALYATLSLFDRGRLAQAIAMDGGQPSVAETRRVGRPTGSRNKPKDAPVEGVTT